CWQSSLIRLALVGVAAFAAPQSSRAQSAESAFDRSIAPLLARRCLQCHNGSDKKGGIDLTSAKSALAGGDSGAAIVAGKPGESLLWERVSQDEMPPKKPLDSAEKKLLEAWIAGGAKWGTDPIDVFRYTTDARAGYDWWSLQPVRRPQPPRVHNGGWAVNDIDRFVL